MKRKTTFKKFIWGVASMFVAAFVLCAFFPSDANAASWGSQDKQNIYIQTYSNWSRPGASKITLKQTPQKVYYYKTSNRSKSRYKKLYGVYRISVYRNGEKIGNTKKWNSSTFNCTMKPDCTYRIEISYDAYSTWYHELSKAPWGYTLDGTRGRKFGWYVSSSNKINYR